MVSTCNMKGLEEVEKMVRRWMYFTWLTKTIRPLCDCSRPLFNSQRMSYYTESRAGRITHFRKKGRESCCSKLRKRKVNNQSR